MLSFLNRILNSWELSQEGGEKKRDRADNEPSCSPANFDVSNTIFAYPSTGGVLQKFCSTVEFHFLGLDHGQVVNRAADPAVEGIFCLQMRKIGRSGGLVWITGLIYGLENSKG